MSNHYIPDEVRFLDYMQQLEENLIEDPVTRCWLWQGLRWGDGYGRIRRFRTCVGLHSRVHVLVYLVFIGSIPVGHYVCHSCDTPLCANPDHLWLGTPRQNVADAFRKERRIGISNTWSEEQRKKFTGAGNPFYGRYHTAESKARMRGPRGPNRRTTNRV